MIPQLVYHTDSILIDRHGNNNIFPLPTVDVNKISHILFDDANRQTCFSVLLITQQ